MSSVKVSTGASLPSVERPQMGKATLVLETGTPNEGVSQSERRQTASYKLDAGPNLGPRGEHRPARYKQEFHRATIVRSDN
jgi:hypothetical protein